MLNKGLGTEVQSKPEVPGNRCRLRLSRIIEFKSRKRQSRKETVAASFVVAILPELRHVWPGIALGYQRNSEASILARGDWFVSYAFYNRGDGNTCELIKTVYEKRK